MSIEWWLFTNQRGKLFSEIIFEVLQRWTDVVSKRTIRLKIIWRNWIPVCISPLKLTFILFRITARINRISHFAVMIIIIVTINIRIAKACSVTIGNDASKNITLLWGGNLNNDTLYYLEHIWILSVKHLQWHQENFVYVNLIVNHHLAFGLNLKW